jgi:hypothetical protein
MEDVDQIAAAIRKVESADDYRHQVVADIGGKPVRKIGAYGIRQDRWVELTQAAALAGADWNDRAAQDAIARRKLMHDYEQLGDWALVGVAFRFGLNAAVALRDAGYTNPGSIEKAGYPEIATYMRALKDGQPMPDQPVTGKLNTKTTTADAPNPTATRAQDIVRRQLYALRNRQRKAQPPVDESAIADTQPEPEQVTA